tara:strand:- start:233 stop:850 length:618 start_codon:yes stop_codon:yes gene_type:complete
MVIKYGYWFFSDVLSKVLCNKIIKGALTKQKGLAITGQKKRKLTKKYVKDLKKTRDSNVVWINDKWIYDIVHPFVHEANRSAGWNYEWSWTEDCQFTIYAEGQHYGWHVDMFFQPSKAKSNGNGKIRKLSSTLLLNDPSEFKGGELEFYFNKDNPDKKRKLVKCNQLDKAGSMVVFPSYSWHRVKPVTKGVRYSLVMWHNGYPFK